MPRISTQLLEQIQTDLRRLQKGRHTWHKIGLVLFNRDGSYAAKVLSGTIIPSEDALGFYLNWKPLTEGIREEASPELCAAVWHHLEPGKEFSQTSREIADYFLVDRRKIRKATEILIDEGFLVGSWTGGYYRIIEPHEKEETIRKLLAHERGIRKRRINLSRIRLVDWRTNAVMVAEGVAQFQLETFR